MNLYSERANEKRRQFNKIINGIDMVLMNNIPEVDDSIWDNFDGDYNFMGSDCDMVDTADVEDMEQEYAHYCTEHEEYTNNDFNCDKYEDMTEVYQWFAVDENDADFLKRHGQYVTYSDMLDTYFLAITHFGTSWDYTSMVDDFDDLYIGLDKFDDEKEV